MIINFSDYEIQSIMEEIDLLYNNINESGGVPMKKNNKDEYHYGKNFN